mmetsp:Transcript_11489/g.18453  ORF Transcript_11489/g.18453 Transcript_11489/m.18453 type:complete len:110 (-) Transcript_11489:586-915(-)
MSTHSPLRHVEMSKVFMLAQFISKKQFHEKADDHDAEICCCLPGYKQIIACFIANKLTRKTSLPCLVKSQRKILNCLPSCREIEVSCRTILPFVSRLFLSARYLQSRQP